MSSLVISTANFGSPNNFYLAPDLIETPQAACVAHVWQDLRNMPANSGTIYRTVQTNNIPAPIYPVPPGSQGGAPVTLSYNTVDVPILQYSQCAYMDTFNINTNQIDVQQEVIRHLGLAMFQAEDIITLNALTNGLSSVSCTQGGGGDSPTPWGPQDALTFYSMLQLNKAGLITPQIGGEDKFGTAPTKASYGCITNLALEASFLNLSQFQQPQQYPSPQFAPTEIGRMNGFVFIGSQNISTYPKASQLGNTIYQSVVTGAKSYIGVHLEGSDKMIINNPAPFTGSAALQTNASSKNIYGVGIVQPTWMFKVLSTASVSATYQLSAA